MEQGASDHSPRALAVISNKCVEEMLHNSRFSVRNLSTSCGGQLEAGERSLASACPQASVVPAQLVLLQRRVLALEQLAALQANSTLMALSHLSYNAAVAAHNARCATCATGGDVGTSQSELSNAPGRTESGMITPRNGRASGEPHPIADHAQRSWPRELGEENSPAPALPPYGGPVRTPLRDITSSLHNKTIVATYKDYKAMSDFNVFEDDREIQRGESTGPEAVATPSSECAGELAIDNSAGTEAHVGIHTDVNGAFSSSQDTTTADEGGHGVVLASLSDCSTGDGDALYDALDCVPRPVHDHPAAHGSSGESEERVVEHADDDEDSAPSTGNPADTEVHAGDHSESDGALGGCSIDDVDIIYDALDCVPWPERDLPLARGVSRMGGGSAKRVLELAGPPAPMESASSAETFALCIAPGHHQQCTDEQFASCALSSPMDDAKNLLQSCTCKVTPTIEQVVQVPVPRTVEETVERTLGRISQVVDVPVPQAAEEIIERTVEVPVPLIVEVADQLCTAASAVKAEHVAREALQVLTQDTEKISEAPQPQSEEEFADVQTTLDQDNGGVSDAVRQVPCPDVLEPCAFCRQELRRQPDMIPLCPLTRCLQSNVARVLRALGLHANGTSGLDAEYVLEADRVARSLVLSGALSGEEAQRRLSATFLTKMSSVVTP